MKVIHQPSAEENWSIKTNCTGFGHTNKGCGVRLKVYRDDLRQRLSEDGFEVTFKCVCCGSLTNIGIDNFPENYKTLKPYKKKWIDQTEDAE